MSPCIRLMFAPILSIVMVVEGSVTIQRRGLRHLAEAPAKDGPSMSYPSLMPQAVVHTDEEPVVLDMSFVNAQIASLNSTFNPKNGTPWFRYKKVTDRGEADHSHFSGLTATGDFKEDIIAGHNVVRHGAGLQGVEWSDALERLAAHRLTELVDGGCYIKHSSTEYRWYAAGFNYVGENLYKVVNMKPTGVDVADAWYAEIEDYTYGEVGDRCVKEKCAKRRSPPCAIGHFTQMMWQKTTHLGCARAECPKQQQRTFIAICHYGPGGNIGGEQPFEGRIASSIGFHSEICPVTGSVKDGGVTSGPSAAIATVAVALSLGLARLPLF